jgi:hypothetical protein
MQLPCAIPRGTGCLPLTDYDHAHSPAHGSLSQIASQKHTIQASPLLLLRAPKSISSFSYRCSGKTFLTTSMIKRLAIVRILNEATRNLRGEDL